MCICTILWRNKRTVKSVFICWIKALSRFFSIYEHADSKCHSIMYSTVGPLWCRLIKRCCRQLRLLLFNASIHYISLLHSDDEAVQKVSEQTLSELTSVTFISRKTGTQKTKLSMFCQKVWGVKCACIVNKYSVNAES